MELSEFLNIALGGGLLATIIGLLTLKSTVRKAGSEAEMAKAEAEAVRIDNAEHATRILMENIVKPLKDEFNETKKELARNTREMARLRKAIETANSCKFRADCPVIFKLRDLTRGSAGKAADGGDGATGQPRARSSPDTDGNGTDVGGEAGDTDGQPP